MSDNENQVDLTPMQVSVLVYYAYQLGALDGYMCGDSDATVLKLIERNGLPAPPIEPDDDSDPEELFSRFFTHSTG